MLILQVMGHPWRHSCAAAFVAAALAAPSAYAIEVTAAAVVATPSPATSVPAAPLLPPVGLPTAPPPDAIKPVEPQADPGVEPEPTRGEREDAFGESYRYVAVIPGDCEHLDVAGRELTTDCSSKLVNIDYGDGRVAFVFITPTAAGAVMTSFSGHASEQLSLRDYRLTLDELATMTSDGGEPQAVVTTPVSGTCTMLGDPLRETATFSCTAKANGKQTRATFRSAGAPTVYAGVSRRDEKVASADLLRR